MIHPFKALLFATLIASSSLSAQDISYDKTMGAEYSLQVEESMGVYNDPIKTEYIATVGSRLIAQLDYPQFDFTFKIVTSNEPNAFALPGGYLYVTTGLIPLLESEDELACIMAHEIIHANNRHSVKSMRKGVLPTILQIPGNLIGMVSETAGNIINAPIKAVSGLSMLSYSRKQETEADIEGVMLAAKAGYDPNALKDILVRLAKTVELTSGETETKSLLSDHPYTPDRVEHIDKIISRSEVPERAKVSSNFLMEFDGILTGNDPAKGVIVKQQYLNPDFNFSITVPEKWDLASQGNMIAGGEAEQKAALYCSFAKSDSTAEQAGKAFRKKLDPAFEKVILGAEAIEVNGLPGYIISFEQSKDGKDIYGFRIWMNMSGTLYQFYGIGFKEYRQTLEQIVYSVKPLNDADKAKVTSNNLKVVDAKEGETISSIGKRTENSLDDKLSALINNHDKSAPFKKGEMVKVVLKMPYFK